MSFSLGKDSSRILATVQPKLQEVVKKAITLTTLDFSVVHGIRTPKEQAEMVAKEVSKTLDSKHVDGLAVDLYPYHKFEHVRQAWWENPAMFFAIATAMHKAAYDSRVSLIWGGSWRALGCPNLNYDPSAEYLQYLFSCGKNNKRIFVDCPHFEIYKTGA